MVGHGLAQKLTADDSDLINLTLLAIFMEPKPKDLNVKFALSFYSKGIVNSVMIKPPSCHSKPYDSLSSVNNTKYVFWGFFWKNILATFQTFVL